ncbi:hypothetical protein ACFYOR_05365 [Streptomyces griseofuscus]
MSRPRAWHRSRARSGLLLGEDGEDLLVGGVLQDGGLRPRVGLVAEGEDGLAGDPQVLGLLLQLAQQCGEFVELHADLFRLGAIARSRAVILSSSDRTGSGLIMRRARSGWSGR